MRIYCLPYLGAIVHCCTQEKGNIPAQAEPWLREKHACSDLDWKKVSKKLE